MLFKVLINKEDEEVYVIGGATGMPLREAMLVAATTSIELFAKVSVVMDVHFTTKIMNPEGLRTSKIVETFGNMLSD